MSLYHRELGGQRAREGYPVCRVRLEETWCDALCSVQGGGGTCAPLRHSTRDYHVNHVFGVRSPFVLQIQRHFAAVTIGLYMIKDHALRWFPQLQVGVSYLFIALLFDSCTNHIQAMAASYSPIKAGAIPTHSPLPTSPLSNRNLKVSILSPK